MKTSPLYPILTLVLLCGIVSCGGPGDRVEIEETLERSNTRDAAAAGASSAERFRGASSAAQAQPEQKRLHWEAPEGWQELAPTQYRSGNFKLGPNGEGECYVSILPGGGGGILENINRWRGQLGLPGYDAVQFTKLRKLTVMDTEAVVVDFEGAYTGMGGGGPKEGYRLKGALLNYEGTGVFIKLIAPAEVVENEEQNFEAFLASIHSTTTHGAATQAPRLTPEQEASGALPAGHPPLGDVSMEPGAVAAAGPSANAAPAAYEWTAPEGWEQEPARSMRLVSYTMGDTEKAQCYVTLLGGAGGGLTMNINRWAAQLGKPELSEAEIQALPTVSVLGQEAPLYEAVGEYSGMSQEAQGGQALLAVPCILEGQSVFIKMTGPEALVLSQKENFIAFCESLQPTS